MKSTSFVFLLILVAGGCCSRAPQVDGAHARAGAPGRKCGCKEATSRDAANSMRRRHTASDDPLGRYYGKNPHGVAECTLDLYILESKFYPMPHGPPRQGVYGRTIRSASRCPAVDSIVHFNVPLWDNPEYALELAPKPGAIPVGGTLTLILRWGERGWYVGPPGPDK